MFLCLINIPGISLSDEEKLPTAHTCHKPVRETQQAANHMGLEAGLPPMNG